MRKILTTALLLLSLSYSYSQIDRYVKLYNDGTINGKELELLIANKDSVQQVKSAAVNEILSTFSRDTYSVQAINPALWIYLKDFALWITDKLLFKDGSDCSKQVKECAEILESYNQIVKKLE